MSIRKFYTQDEIDEAKSKLEALPDLSHQRIPRSGVLESLKGTILMLANEKGYSQEDIKSALDAMDFNFSMKAISVVLNEDSVNKKRRGKKSAQISSD